MKKIKNKLAKKIRLIKLIGLIILVSIVSSLGAVYAVNTKYSQVQSGVGTHDSRPKYTSAQGKKTGNSAKSKSKTKPVKKVRPVAKPINKAAVTNTPKPEPVIKPAPTSKVDKLKPTKTTTSPRRSSSSPGSSNNNQQTTGYSSLNWSGYLATNRIFTSVSGSWAVPSVRGNGSTTSADGAWIGIGGVTGGDLIQVGTENVVSPSGKVTSSVFYELLPALPVRIASVAVKAGDNISASITQLSTNLWSISVSNLTTGKSYAINVNYSSSRSTAEWIQEVPSYANGSLVPFNNFGIINFWAASTTANGVSHNLKTVNALPITLVTNGMKKIAVPSLIGPNGASFSVTQL